MDYNLKLFMFSTIWRHTNLGDVLCRSVLLNHLSEQKVAYFPHQKSHTELYLTSDKIYSIQLKYHVFHLLIFKFLIPHWNLLKMLVILYRNNLAFSSSLTSNLASHYSAIYSFMHGFIFWREYIKANVFPLHAT